ncbi:NRAMP family divalent metal transporter [Schleiferia thermophila]|jgi:Mn2+/Fe2+ NRAMP family transporter|uniref:NRAMP family divalent metal transporter n=1 Tax=Schleiferia thermophila TaxID=884107 RepID=UPI0004E6BC5D|nr:divalent metal cation transporter [Schleiferia thermophila]KFD39009.1 transporter [Schleiferia thermophila str. Yellowstone]PMB37351.1 divalent metal cation transporter [Fischerella thermalis CCMEE 5319]
MIGNNFKIKNLGPGLLYAGAAVGVSHLVQSTRAGAEYGLLMIVPVVLANLLKWPFFFAGPYYAAAKGESLIIGYHRLGKLPFYTNLCIAATTVPGILGAVTLVTAGIFNVVLGIETDIRLSSALILGIALFVLIRGRYAILDRLIKWIIAVLSLSTVVAVALLWQAPSHSYWRQIDWGNYQHITFLIALMGWMPAPIDLSIWQSIWSVEKFKIQPDARKIFKIDFNIGFIATAFLAVVFLLLGFFSLYNKENQLPADAVGFAASLISMYEVALGSTVSLLIKIAALTCMISTVITVLDAYPRVIAESIVIARGKGNLHRWNEFVLWVVATSGMVVILFFKTNMKDLVTLATVISFITAPVLAWFNTQLLRQIGFFPRQIFSINKILTSLGLLYLIAFTIIYLFITFR